MQRSGSGSRSRLSLNSRRPGKLVANPLVAWTIPASRAWIEGADVGGLGPLPDQEHLGDFWIPQRGLFAMGRAYVEPLDPARHRCETHARP